MRRRGIRLTPRGLDAQPPLPDEPLVDLSRAESGTQLTKRSLQAVRRRVSAGSLGAIALSCMTVLTPLALGKTVQYGLVSLQPALLAVWMAVLGVAGLIRIWATTFKLNSNTGAAMVEHDLRLRTLERIVDPGGIGVSKRTPGELVTLTVSDTRAVSRAVVAMTSVPGNYITVSGCLVLLLLIDWRLTVLVVIALPILILLSVKGIKPVQTRTRRERQVEARAAGMATDLTAGLRVIQGIAATERAARYFRVASQAGVRATIATRRARGAYVGAVNAAIGLLSALLTIGAALLAVKHTIGPADVVTVVSIGQTLASPLRSLGIDTATMLAAAHASGDRICELVNNGPRCRSGSETAPLADGPKISLLQLRTPALSAPLTLDIPAGQFCAAVAPPAVIDDLAGLATRSIAPIGGSLIVDGHIASDWAPDAWPRRILTAPEKSTLFDGTVRYNLELGKKIPPELLASALEACAAGDVIEDLPDGLESFIGEAGSRLSGGQRQRLALARALIHAKGMLLLVNPTTSVDPVTEVHIAEGIRRFRASFHPTSSTVVLTASPILLAACDTVLWLGERGQVQGRGRHADLLTIPQYREALS